MLVNQYEKDGAVIYELEGKMLGGPDTNQLYENIRQKLEENVSAFIINLEEVKWINSSGLGILINIFNVSKQNNAKLIIVSNSEQVKKMLKITRLDNILTTRDSLEEALKMIKES